MSGFSASSCSSSYSSTCGPSTPSTASSSSSYHRRPSSEDEHSITTPPGSLRDYSASLKARHTLGMAAAMKSIPLERDPSRYDRMRSDDNPFDHLYQSPTPAVQPTISRRREGSGEMEVEEKGEAVRAERRKSKRASTEVEGLPPFKPALINFHRTHSDEPTPTPGSATSEASFEASAPEDYFRVYGRPICSYSPIDLSAYQEEDPLSAPIYSFMAPESPFEQPSSRMSMMSTTTESTITSMSSSGTITSLHSSASSGTLAAQIGVAGTARMSRPSLLRPRPRVHPYESTNGRQRENSGGARGMSFAKEEEEMQEDGRSVSEVMVAMAGLRCQRGRAMRG